MLTDVNLPDMDGQALAREMRRRRPGLPIVFATGYRMVRRNASWQGGPTAVLNKPFCRDELAAALGKVLLCRASDRRPERFLARPGLLPCADLRNEPRRKSRCRSISRCVADLHCRVGESPVYDERTERLYFVDILSRDALRAPASQPASSRRGHSRARSARSGLTASGALVVALRDSVILFDPRSEARVELCRIEADRPETRLNDGRVGPDGAFWVGSMDDRPTEGADRRALPRRSVRPRGAQGGGRSSSPTASPGRRTAGPCSTPIRAGRGSTAGASTRRPARSRSARASPTPDDTIGRPDGGSCDAEGFYWSAGVSAGRLNRFAPDGSLADSFARAGAGADDALLRRAGFPHALSDQPDGGPPAGSARQGARRRRAHRGAGRRSPVSRPGGSLISEGMGTARKPDRAFLARAIAAGAGREPADLVIRDVDLLDVITGEVTRTDVAIVGDRIVGTSCALRGRARDRRARPLLRAGLHRHASPRRILARDAA